MYINYVYLISFFFGALIISLIAVSLCIKLSFYFGIVDKPDGVLKVHVRTTPYMGGVAVYAALLIPLYLSMPQLIPGLTLLCLFGLVDDFYRLSPRQLFLGHVCGAVLLLFCMPILSISPYPLVSYSLALFWLLSLINAFNLIDVMDGLLGVAIFFIALGFGFYSILLQKVFLLYLSAAVAGAIIGFLWFNKPVAKVYMGDAGSLMLGGLFGSLSLLMPWPGQGISFFFIPLVLLAIPVGELVLLLGIRTYKGIPFFKGSHDHFSHYLKKKGWTVYQILLIVSFLSFTCFALSVAYFYEIVSLITYTLSVAALFIVFVVYLLR